MLLSQMDLNGVDRATIVCAQIFQNFGNNDYVAAAVRKFSDRLDQFADVDSFWSETYHITGAAARLEQAAKKWPMKGFTHYVAAEDDAAWFDSQDGRDFFGVANSARLIASIACGPQHQPAIRKVAERYPGLTVLCHHMSGLRAYGDDARQKMDLVLPSAELPNVHLKLSGFHYVSPPENSWDFPYSDAKWVYEECYAAFGRRMAWGSDYPVVTRAMTHRQSLEAFRTHCRFVSEDDREAILGGTLESLLQKARAVKKV
jgi:predicted TIM-barrel fold metal-dependent hydrolase